MGSKSEKRRRRVAGWIGIPGVSLWGALKALESLFGLGGASGNAEGWREAGLVMLSLTPPWLMPALLVGGGVALAIYLVGVVPEAYSKGIRRAQTLMETPEGVKRLSTAINIVMGVVTITVRGGLIYYLAFVHEPTETVWTHPMMTTAEQVKAKAECRMRASEVYRNRLRNWTAHAQYEADCLTAKGFKLERVDHESKD